jgi:hypothetical protein
VLVLKKIIPVQLYIQNKTGRLEQIGAINRSETDEEFFVMRCFLYFRLRHLDIKGNMGKTATEGAGKKGRTNATIFCGLFFVGNTGNLFLAIVYGTTGYHGRSHDYNCQ